MSARGREGEWEGFSGFFFHHMQYMCLIEIMIKILFF